MTAVAESISNGNMTGWGSTAYAWDEFNRLVAINGTSLDASYKYDALGRRIEKTLNGTTTRYLYDGADIVLEMNENNAATIYYIRTLNIDEPLARIELDSGGNVTGIRFYLADALGSIIALTDENGDIKTRYNYTPFGEPEVIGDSSNNPFMFTGREYDEWTGLYYYRARYYSWELGRFISEDPIGLAGGINFYAYVGNSPLNFVDPWGLKPGDPFNSPEEAAIDAIEYIWGNKPDWKEVEYGGWILKTDKGFTYEEPIRGTANGFPLPTKTDMCADAWYHTHPEPSLGRKLVNLIARITGAEKYRVGEMFSIPNDLDVSDRTNSIGYLGTTSQRILRYKPGPRTSWESRVEELKGNSQ